MTIESECEPEHFKGRILFMSMFLMTLIGENEETERIVLRMLTELLSMLEDLRKDIGHV